MPTFNILFEPLKVLNIETTKKKSIHNGIHCSHNNIIFSFYTTPSESTFYFSCNEIKLIHFLLPHNISNGIQRNFDVSN